MGDRPSGPRQPGSRQLCSTRFADALTGGTAGAGLVVLEDCAHAPIYENVQAFNDRTLAFLQRHSGEGARRHAESAASLGPPGSAGSIPQAS